MIFYEMLLYKSLNSINMADIDRINENCDFIFLVKSILEFSFVDYMLAHAQNISFEK